MEPESALLFRFTFSQEPENNSYPEPDESSPNTHPIILLSHLYNHLPEND
jgi:hypothetical protein